MNSILSVSKRQDEESTFVLLWVAGKEKPALGGLKVLKGALPKLRFER